jgi:hypothetical protein
MPPRSHYRRAARCVDRSPGPITHSGGGSARTAPTAERTRPRKVRNAAGNTPVEVRSSRTLPSPARRPGRPAPARTGLSRSSAQRRHPRTGAGGGWIKGGRGLLTPDPPTGRPLGIAKWQRYGMAMTLQPGPDEEAALERPAHRWRVSKQQAALRAIREQGELLGEDLLKVSGQLAERYSEALDRLGSL